MDTTVVLSIVAFMLIVGLLAYLRTRSGNAFEIKNSEIILALIPIVLFLLLTGKIQRFEFGELRIEAAFVEASQAAIAPQVTSLEGLPVETLRFDMKAGVEHIPALVQRKTQALVFRFGHGGYFGPAIERYLEELTRYPFFRLLIVHNSDGSLFGILDAHEVVAAMNSQPPLFSGSDFAQWLNKNEQSEIEKLPGFISAENALFEETDKKAALERMEMLNLEMLPVVDSRHRFAGIVDRSRLTASLILEVTEQLQVQK